MSAPVSYSLLEFPCRQNKECFARFVLVPPFDLIQADLYVEWVKVVFMFIADQLFINGIRVFEFLAGGNLQQARGLEQVPPPGWGVLLLEIIFKNVDMLIWRRQSKGINLRWVRQLFCGELCAQNLGSNTDLPTGFQMPDQMPDEALAAAVEIEGVHTENRVEKIRGNGSSPVASV